MKTTILGGVLFLVPVAVLALVIGKAFHLSMMVAEPLDKFIPIETVGGIALVNVIAVILILLVCFGAGLAARAGVMATRIEQLDGFMIDLIPGYAVAKGVLGSVAQEDRVAEVLKPVTVQFDDYAQIAFEIERSEDKAVLFLPGAPSTWAGATVAVDVARVRPLDVPTHQVVKLMRLLGRGSLKTKAFDAPPRELP